MGALLEPYAFTGAPAGSVAFDAGRLRVAPGAATPKARIARAITAQAALGDCVARRKKLASCENCGR